VSQVNIRLLGSPHIEADHNAISFGTRKATALIAYLAVTAQVHMRDTLISLLWPEYEYEQALAALRTTLWTIRKQMGTQCLLVSRQQIGLKVSDEVWIDVREFSALADSGLARDLPQSAAVNFLEKAVALYQGDLLAGFTLKDSVEFDEWQLLETQSLRQMFGRVLETLVQCYTDRGDYAQALAYAQRQVSFEPLDEAAHRSVM
jgi:DNA-binding SARP family transcriptional activator